MPQSPYSALADDALWPSLVVAGLSRLPPEEATSAEIAAYLTDCRETLAQAGAARIKNDNQVSVMAVVRLRLPIGTDTPVTLRGVCLLSTDVPPVVLTLYELPSDVRLASPDHYADVALVIGASRVVDVG